MLRARLTPARLEWLRALEQQEQRRQGKGRTGCDCMRLGWTEWVRDAEGHVNGSSRERLTEEGRAMLRTMSVGEA